MPNDGFLSCLFVQEFCSDRFPNILSGLLYIPFDPRFVAGLAPSFPCLLCSSCHVVSLNMLSDAFIFPLLAFLWYVVLYPFALCSYESCSTVPFRCALSETNKVHPGSTLALGVPVEACSVGGLGILNPSLSLHVTFTRTPVLAPGCLVSQLACRFRAEISEPRSVDGGAWLTPLGVPACLLLHCSQRL